MYHFARRFDKCTWDMTPKFIIDKKIRDYYYKQNRTLKRRRHVRTIRTHGIFRPCCDVFVVWRHFCFLARQPGERYVNNDGHKRFVLLCGHSKATPCYYPILLLLWMGSLSRYRNDLGIVQDAKHPSNNMVYALGIAYAYSGFNLWTSAI